MAEAATLSASDVKERPLLVHIMHDIETFSTQNNPVIPAIGAVKFTREGVVDRFELGVDPKDCQRYGLHMCADTVLWWMDEKRDAARKYLLAMGRVDLFTALDGYAMWIAQTPADMLGGVWANGATFDHIKLRSAYDAVKIDYPFHYRKEMCYRTIANSFPDVEFQRQGLHHGALDDSLSQAFHLVEIDRVHGINL